MSLGTTHKTLFPGAAFSHLECCCPENMHLNYTLFCFLAEMLTPQSGVGSGIGPPIQGLRWRMQMAGGRTWTKLPLVSACFPAQCPSLPFRLLVFCKQMVNCTT